MLYSSVSFQITLNDLEWLSHTDIEWAPPLAQLDRPWAAINSRRAASISCWSRSDRGKCCAIMCDQQTQQSRSFQISQHRRHLTSFTRHRAKTDHAESTHYGSALQLYGISISRHCAQCVDSLYCLQNGSRWVDSLWQRVTAVRY